jgi:hypothetical protein
VRGHLDFVVLRTFLQLCGPSGKELIKVLDQEERPNGVDTELIQAGVGVDLAGVLLRSENTRDGTSKA